MKTCTSCKGKKKVMGLGFISKTCEHCAGTGIEEVQAKDDGVIFPFPAETMSKRRPGRPKKIVDTEVKSDGK